MKTKTLTIITVFLFLTAILQAQTPISKKEKKAAKKAQEQAQRDSVRVIQENWVENKTFVLEAQQVYNKIGEVFHLNPSTNFVYFNLDKGIIQLSFNGLIGWNGIGGITVKGNIIKYEYDIEKKDKPIYIQATIQGTEGFQDIVLWISNNGNGDANITGMRGDRIRFTGDIVSLEDSRIYIGTERF
ncbi:MAG: DUF4251 domain-containing protein [Bacteroidales bacterium]|nr:DUF4251 domain-containing protein [Bacteroidales bacterium]